MSKMHIEQPALVSVEPQPARRTLRPLQLLDEAQRLEPCTAPWRIDVIDNVGENWLLADLGEDMDCNHYILTTDEIHGSELSRSDPASDGAWMVWCRNHWDVLLRGLAALAEAEERARLDAWNGGQR